MAKHIRYFAIFLLLPQMSWACSHCFGANVDTATTQGISYAMLGLLVVTGLVSTGIVAFFMNIRKRSRLYSQSQKEG